MRTKIVLLFAIILILLGLAWVSTGARAESGGLQRLTPRPLPNRTGRSSISSKPVIYAERISLLYGVSLDYLRNTNQLDANCSLREGQRLQLGVGGPSLASPTPGPSAIPTLIQSTPTPVAGGKADVCVLIYDDVNGDGLRQTSEVAVSGAAISLTSLDGTFSQTLTSIINPDATAYQGMCFTSVPMGSYNVSAAAPDGYNPTIDLSSSLQVAAGDIDYIDYGAQVKSIPSGQVPSKGPSPLLGIIGVAFLLAGIGMAVYVWTIFKEKGIAGK